MTLEDRCGTDDLISAAKFLEETLIVHSVKGNTVEARLIIGIEAPDGSTWRNERVVRVRLQKDK